MSPNPEPKVTTTVLEEPRHRRERPASRGNQGARRPKDDHGPLVAATDISTCLEGSTAEFWSPRRTHTRLAGLRSVRGGVSMNQPGRRLSQDQREYLRPALAKVTEGLTELRQKLSELGWSAVDFSCLAEPSGHCESWVEPDGGLAMGCARTGCGHGFTSHAAF
jgi:hypothetical protein